MKLILILSLLLNTVLIAGGYYALQSLGGARYVLYKMSNRGTTGVYGHRKMQFEMLPVQNKDIIMLGNSITEQGEWAELMENHNVKNRGIAGDGTVGLLERLGEITRGQPRQIFLMIGINDLLFHDAEFTLSNYETIVERIQRESPSTELILQSVLPTNDNVRNIGINFLEIQKLNRGIAALADRAGLKYLNLYETFRDVDDNLNADYTDDGIHLNGKAYLIWRDVLKKHIPPR